MYLLLAEQEIFGNFSLWHEKVSGHRQWCGERLD